MNKCNKIDDELLNKIIILYTIDNLTLREIAKKFSTNHKYIGRVLLRNNIKITKKYKKRIFSIETRRKMSEARKGKSYNIGIKHTIETRLKNMVSRLNRPLVTYKILSKFQNIDKLIFLNRVISRNRIYFDDILYLKFINKFYYDEKFNIIYNKWIENNKNKWLMPSIDHINPLSNGGNFEIENLRFITWFENRAKADMALEEWENVKNNIYEYFI
jgi:hypothetical protein